MSHRRRAAKDIASEHLPWAQRPGRDRIFAAVDEIRMTGSQELGPVIEGEAVGAPCRDPSADATALVEDRGPQAVGRGKLRGGQAGHAAAENDKVDGCAAVHLYRTVRLCWRPCWALETDL